MDKKFCIISLGCPRNLVDSEKLIGEFKNKGYSYSGRVNNVHTLIINTCGFIEDAKKESIDLILKAIEAKKDGRVKKVLVAGCLSRRYAAELRKEFPDVDEFRGVIDVDRGVRQRVPFYLTPRHYTYIKISEGCLNRCSYCAIPFIKGPYKSRPLRGILREAAALLRGGAREIILVGQDTSLYGVDIYGKKMLARLLRELEGISKDNWIRLLYLHPANVDRDLIKAIKDSAHVCKYVDLPVEHISDKILRRMKRKTTKKDIVSLIEYIRREMPGAAIRTSLIVGFPGEGEGEFKELLSFVRDVRFERLGVFKYSREEGTEACAYRGHVSESEKQRRLDEVMALQQEISKDINRRFVGRELKVLIEGRESGLYFGRSEYDAPEVDGSVFVRGTKKIMPGYFYRVLIDRTHEYDLEGVFV